MGFFIHGVVGGPPLSKKKKKKNRSVRTADIKKITPPAIEPQVEIIVVDQTEEEEEELLVPETVIEEQLMEEKPIEVEKVEKPTPLIPVQFKTRKVKDMTEEERKAFYKERAKKAAETRRRNKLLKSTGKLD